MESPVLQHREEGRSLLENMDAVFEEDEELWRREIAELEDSDAELAPQNLSPHIWANTYWDRMPADEREEYMVELLRPTLERAITDQGIYAQSDAFANLDPDDVESFADLLDWPVLTKDGADGFRQDVIADPCLMRPENARTGLTIYESGGSGGGATPTYLSDEDMEVDAAGLTRAFSYGGIEEGDVVLNGYNPSHKGGRAIFRATELLGGEPIPMRPEEDAETVASKIDRYDVDALAAVETGQGIDKKSGGKNFFGLLQQDYDAVTGIDKWFVTGYPLVDDLTDLSDSMPVTDNNGTRDRLFTTYGTSETIPLASSTATYADTPAQYNTQHLLEGPHHVEVAVPDGSGGMRQAEDGEQGVALITSIDRRDGTIYLNYAIGDSVEMYERNPQDSYLSTPVVANIEKVDDPLETLEGGCTVV